jgi:hypothetical protein
MNATIATSNDADRNGSACASRVSRGNVSGARRSIPTARSAATTTADSAATAIDGSRAPTRY